MAVFQKSSLDNILKDGWEPLVANDINRKAKLYKLFRKGSEPFQIGNNWYVRFKSLMSSSFGWSDDDGHMPPKDKPSYERYTIPVKMAYSQFTITALAISQGAAVPNSMQEALMAIKEDTTELCIKRLNQALYGDGTAKLGAFTAVNSNVSLTFGAVAGDTTGDKRWRGRYLNGNETIAIHDANDDTVRGTTTATKMTHSTNILLVPNTQSADPAATSDYACLALQGSNQSSFDKAVWGLEYHVSDVGDSSGNYQGLIRANIERSRANVNSGSGTDRPLTLALMEEACIQRAVSSDALEEDEQVILMDLGMRQSYIDLLHSQIRYIPEVLEGGTKKDRISYNGVPLQVDSDCTYNTIYFLTPGDFKYHVLEDWKFEDQDGGVLYRSGGSTNKHQFDALFYSFLNVSCSRPKAQTKLSDISQTVLAA